MIPKNEANQVLRRREQQVRSMRRLGCRGVSAEKGPLLEETEWEKAEASWDGRSSAIRVPEPMQNVTFLARNFSKFCSDN